MKISQPQIDISKVAKCAGPSFAATTETIHAALPNSSYCGWLSLQYCQHLSKSATPTSTSTSAANSSIRSGVELVVRNSRDLSTLVVRSSAAVGVRGLINPLVNEVLHKVFLALRTPTLASLAALSLFCRPIDSRANRAKSSPPPAPGVGHAKINRREEHDLQVHAFIPSPEKKVASSGVWRELLRRQPSRRIHSCGFVCQLNTRFHLRHSLVFLSLCLFETNHHRFPGLSEHLDIATPQSGCE